MVLEPHCSWCFFSFSSLFHLFFFFSSTTSLHYRLCSVCRCPFEFNNHTIRLRSFRSIHHRQLVAQSHYHVLCRFCLWFSTGFPSSSLLWLLCCRYLEASCPFGTSLSLHSLLELPAAFLQSLVTSCNLLQPLVASCSLLEIFVAFMQPLAVPCCLA